VKIGSGFGISKKFLKYWKILQTDYLEIPRSTIVGAVDVQDLPYKDGIFTTVFGVDVLHHIPDPVKALKEVERVINKESNLAKCVFIEPYVSFISYPIFKLFHDEKTYLFRNRRLIPPLVNEQPNDADQMIPKWLFESRTGKRKIENIFPSNHWSIQIRHIDPLSFFATGGLSRPLHSRAEIIQRLQMIESKLGARLQKVIASRIVIVIRKL
jgi:SAM-dependent methyltransferase